MAYLEDRSLPELGGECLWDEGKQAWPRASVFLLAIAAISVAREVGHWLIFNALLAWLGITLDPFLVSVALQVVVTLIGVGVAGLFLKASPDSAARWDMPLILLAAMGIGLILAWLSDLVGYTNALGWPPVLVYLLRAWAAAASAA